MRCTMTYTDLIFDLYGTLVDIHTEESAEVWEKDGPLLWLLRCPLHGRRAEAGL